MNGKATDTTLVDGEYIFTIKSGKGVTTPTDATLKITITRGEPVSATLDNNNLKIDDDGYVLISGLPVGEYTVEEDITGLKAKGITLTSENSQTVIVTKDNDTDIPAAVFVNNKDVGSLRIEKQVKGTAAKDKEFTFEITLTAPKDVVLDESYPASQNGSDATASVKDGNVTVTLKADEYYEINELPAGTKYAVVETESEIPKGYTLSESTGAYGSISTDTVTAKFVNTYNTEGDITFSGTKELNNRELKEGEFTFELYGSDGEMLESVTNKADGSYSFKTIEYTGEDLDTDEDDHYVETKKTYKVVEKAGDDKLIIYDKTEYEITVTLKDDGKGTIETTADPEESTYDFVNTYIAKGEIMVQKVLDGRDWTNDDTFTFTLKAITENAPMPAETTLEITGETKDHLKSFGSIDFIKEGSYKYVVTEKKGDAKGLTYDEKEHEVTITVEYDEKGNLVASSDSALIQTVTITNTYVDIKVKKVDDSDKAVKGAVLAVKDSNGTIVDKWTTDGTVYDVQNLKPDTTYTLTELSAPEGYKKSADIKFTTGPDGRVQVLKMVDKKSVAPNTSDTNHIAGWTASLITSMLGALAVLLMRRKYKYR